MEKIAVVALSKHGRLLAKRIASVYPGKTDLYLKENVIHEEDIAQPFAGGELGALFGQLFAAYRGIVCIMALGIVVRKIAPHLVDKRKDPAIIVLDERGQAVISVLSGHLGGANQLTCELAALLDAHPVITTATDLHGKLALDLLAQQLHCEILPFAALKKISGAIVNEQAVAFYSQYPLPDLATEQIRVYPLTAYDGRIEEEAAVFVTNQTVLLPEGKTIVFLRPKNMVIGIGCRRGTKKEALEKAVLEALERSGRARASIRALASIDIKSDELGLLELAEAWDLPLRFYGKEEINRLAGTQADSAFVREKIGVKGVCEQTAILSLQQPQLVLEKSVFVPGVTVAIAEEKFLL